MTDENKLVTGQPKLDEVGKRFVGNLLESVVESLRQPVIEALRQPIINAYQDSVWSSQQELLEQQKQLMEGLIKQLSQKQPINITVNPTPVNIQNTIDMPEMEITVSAVQGPPGTPGLQGPKGDQGEPSEVSVTVDKPKMGPVTASISHSDGTTSTVSMEESDPSS